MDPFIARNLTFGIEDSLISTTGVLVGIAAANFEARHIVATGLVLIVAEAFSMAYGAFLSEENFIRSEGKRRAPLRETALYGAVMFASYFAVGLVLLAPYALRVPHASAVVVGIALALLAALVATFERRPARVVALTGAGAAVLGASIAVGRWMKV